jgi:hypothetical protein
VTIAIENVPAQLRQIRAREELAASDAGPAPRGWCKYMDLGCFDQATDERLNDRVEPPRRNHWQVEKDFHTAFQYRDSIPAGGR